MANKAYQKTYTQLEAITKATVSLRAQGVSNDELAVVDGRLAQVVKTKGDLVTLQIFSGTEGIPTDAAVTFLGGSLGLSAEVSKRGDFKLSFSKMTFPHQMMRVVLLEQVYRSFKIMRHEAYHK